MILIALILKVKYAQMNVQKMEGVFTQLAYVTAIKDILDLIVQIRKIGFFLRK